MFGFEPFSLLILIIVSYDERIEESCRVIVSPTARTVALISGRADYWGRRLGLKGCNYTFGKRRVERRIGRACVNKERSAFIERSGESVVSGECGHNSVIVGRKKRKWLGNG